MDPRLWLLDDLDVMGCSHAVIILCMLLLVDELLVSGLIGSLSGLGQVLILVLLLMI